MRIIYSDPTAVGLACFLVSHRNLPCVAHRQSKGRKVPCNDHRCDCSQYELGDCTRNNSDKFVRDFRSYAEIVEQNQELRLELQRMKSWKEAAIQLEQENARLLI